MTYLRYATANGRYGGGNFQIATTAIGLEESSKTSNPMTGSAPAPTFIADPTNQLPAWFGPLVPADFWAFDSMRRVPMAQTMPPEQSRH